MDQDTKQLLGFVEMAPGNPGVNVQMQPQPTFAPLPVVTSQPMATTIINVTQGNFNYPRGTPRDWSTPLCGCFEDCCGCLLGAFFPLCYMCYVSTKMGESCCTPCCVCSAGLVMRSHFRGRHNIQGSLINDACTSCWCGNCMICQISREIDNIKAGRAAP